MESNSCPYMNKIYLMKQKKVGEGITNRKT
jgi:hypothetical protein